jgi:prepilin-type N-terminal cleavage/methylation domain-containing protein
LKRRARGVTLVEILLATAILSIVSLVFARVTQVIMRSLSTSESMSRTVTASQTVFSYLEYDLYNANEIVVAEPRSLMFICDISKRPGYVVEDPSNPDVDGDIDQLAMAPQSERWKHGYNLSDDDDDNDGHIDYAIRYWVQDGVLYKDWVGNVGASLDDLKDLSHWGHHVKSIAPGIAYATFTYYGNVENALGAKLDTGHDGIAGSSDAGEKDGIVDSTEIDMTAPPDGAGNRNGLLDTPEEMKYLTSVRIHFEIDNNKDNKIDFTLNTEVYPPMLPLKPLQR